MYFARPVAAILIALALSGCGGMSDDLFPSGDDKRPPALGAVTGPEVGQHAPDFSVSDTSGGTVSRDTALASGGAFVLYFTMWCPVCDSHMSHMRDTIIPLYPGTAFFAVDYVSGTVTEAGVAELSNGYKGSGFTVLADVDHAMLDSYAATMGTCVVVDSGGIVRMNEDFKDGSRLLAVLGSLP